MTTCRIRDVCPKCGRDDFNTLEGIELDTVAIECTNCHWDGTTEELVRVMVKGEVVEDGN